METSLRYGVESKSLRIHAKEKFPIDSNTHLQVHGELDTRLGAPSHVSAMIRQFYPDLPASLGVGLQYDKHEKVRYFIRVKTGFNVTNDGLMSLDVKGRCDVDKEFKQRKPKAAAELTLNKYNFRRDQDVRFRIGYEMITKVPYMQIRENNWTLNADMNGKWNVRFDL